MSRQSSGPFTRSPDFLKMALNFTEGIGLFFEDVRTAAGFLLQKILTRAKDNNSLF